MNNQHKIKGFTLIEALIVVVIASILTALAVSNYSKYIMESRRTEATSTLLNMRLAEEKHRSNNTTYGSLAQVWSSVSSTENGHYTLVIGNLSGTTYTLTATAVGNQLNDKEGSTTCSPMQIAVDGLAVNKTPSGCW